MASICQSFLYGRRQRRRRIRVSAKSKHNIHKDHAYVRISTFLSESVNSVAVIDHGMWPAHGEFIGAHIEHCMANACTQIINRQTSSKIRVNFAKALEHNESLFSQAST